MPLYFVPSREASLHRLLARHLGEVVLARLHSACCTRVTATQAYTGYVALPEARCVRVSACPDSFLLLAHHDPLRPFSAHNPRVSLGPRDIKQLQDYISNERRLVDQCVNSRPTGLDCDN